MQRLLYPLSAIIAIILAVVVWQHTPQEYAAQVKIADEYKETDLAIGLNKFNVAIRDNDPDAGNKGQNNIDIYSKILDDGTFQQGIAKMQGVSAEHVKEHLLYKLHSRQQTLDIQYVDADPKVAATVLGTIVHRLQWRIWKYRGQITVNTTDNAQLEVDKAEQALDSARAAYLAYAESHHDAVAPKVLAEFDRLKADVTLKEQSRAKAYDNLTRQKSLSNKKPDAFFIAKNVTVPHESTSHLVGYVLTFLFFALVLTHAALSFIKKPNFHLDFGDIFSPWFLTIFIWVIALILYSIQSASLYPLRPQFWQSLTLWLPIFCISAWLVYWANFSPDDSNRKASIQPLETNVLAFNVLWIISMCLSPLYIYTVMKVVMQFDTANLLFNIRELAVRGRATSLILNAVQAINICLFITAIWLYPRISKWKLLTIVIAYLLVEFAMMEKSGLLIMILSLLFVLYERKTIRLRSILITLAGIIVFFYFFNMSKKAQTADAMSFADFFAIYITSPAVAFSYLTPDLEGQFGINTFGQVYQYLNVFGFEFDYAQRLQEFAWVPIPTNVFTIFQPFYEDFGLKGIAVFAGIYGSVFGWIYSRFRSGSFICRCLYTYLVEVIIIQFYNENLIQNLFLSVGFLVWTIIVCQPVTFSSNTEHAD